MTLFVDATTAIALGRVGELDLLTNFDRTPTILPSVRAEVTTEPAATNLRTFLESNRIAENPRLKTGAIEKAREILGEDGRNGDVEIIAAVFQHSGDGIGVVSDDRRVRTTARSLGVTVTGTIGVVVRAVEAGYSAEEGKELVRRIDGHGLHLTGELRETAYDLIDDAANE